MARPERASVTRPADGLELRFVLTGKDGRVPVVYRGVVPDTFDLAESVTVGGRVTADGGFAADQLLVQCPSKYEAVPPGQADAAGGDRDG
ncbi:MAG: cytochrome c maturation protein CcmE [Chloroflexi bacterium CFX6]|nr:cytochrome c maturation protein CcmE [Chloroflexi bacterium CFX6]